MKPSRAQLRRRSRPQDTARNAAESASPRALRPDRWASIQDSAGGSPSSGPASSRADRPSGTVRSSTAWTRPENSPIAASASEIAPSAVTKPERTGMAAGTGGAGAMGSRANGRKGPAAL